MGGGGTWHFKQNKMQIELGLGAFSLILLLQVRLAELFLGVSTVRYVVLALCTAVHTYYGASPRKWLATLCPWLSHPSGAFFYGQLHALRSCLLLTSHCLQPSCFPPHKRPGEMWKGVVAGMV